MNTAPDTCTHEWVPVAADAPTDVCRYCGDLRRRPWVLTDHDRRFLRRCRITVDA
jgi:hypothetical protein